MPTLNEEDFQQIIHIVKELIKQEIDTKFPIYSELIDLKAVVKELVETQKRTEEEPHSLALIQKDFQKQVGGISHSLGFDLENQSYKALSNLLKRDFELEVKERLIRKFIKTKKENQWRLILWGRLKKIEKNSIL